jgi:hypothetical protein
MLSAPFALNCCSVARGIVECFEQFLPALLMGTANKELVEQHFYSLIVGDGDTGACAEPWNSPPAIFEFILSPSPQFDDVAVCVLRWVADLTGQIRGIASRI